MEQRSAGGHDVTQFLTAGNRGMTSQLIVKFGAEFQSEDAVFVPYASQE